MVTTLFGATYWGTLAIAGANVPGFTSTGSSRAIVLAQKGRRQACTMRTARQSTPQIVGPTLPSQYLPGVSSAVVMRRPNSRALFAGVKVAKGGRYIRVDVRRRPAKSRNRHGDLEELGLPTGMIDECAMAARTSTAEVTQAWDVSRAAPQARGAKPRCKIQIARLA